MGSGALLLSKFIHSGETGVTTPAEMSHTKAAPLNEREFSLGELLLDPKLQVRNKLDPVTVARYASAYKAGTELPPVKVAMVDGKVPTVVDGWHRIAALRSIGRLHVTALVVPQVSRQDATWLAAEANLTHGLPLTNAEMKNVFKAYVRSGRNLNRKKLKPFREIGRELGKSHHTIANWMQQFFPKVYRRYAADDVGGDKGGLMPRASTTETPLATCERFLDAALVAARGITEHGERVAIAAKIKGAIKWLDQVDQKEIDAYLQEDF